MRSPAQVEGLDALDPVGGECRLFPRPVLDFQAAGQVDVEALTKRALGGTQAYRGLGGDFLGELICAATSRTFRNDSVDKSNSQRLVGGDLSPSEYQIGRAVQSDPTRQQLSAAAAWNEAQAHLRQCKNSA